MLRFLIYFIVVAFPLSGYALTVDDAVNMALETNNVIKNKESLVEAREYESKNAILVYFPSIGASYNYGQYWDDYTTAKKPDENYDSSSAVISATFNIFNGLHDKNVVDVAKLGQEMASTDLAASKYDIILKARNDFISVLKAQSNLKVAEENLQLLRMQKRDAQLSADNGLIARNDLLQVDTYLASAELQRINAQSALVIARQTLENTINKPIGSDEILVEPVMSNVIIESEEVLKDKMFQNNSQIKYLEQSYTVAKKSENMVKSSLYPTIDLKASYSAYGDDVWAWSGSKGAKDSSTTVGVTASWNLLNAFSGYYQSRGKKKETMALGYTIADTKQAMTLQLNAAIETHLTALATLEQSEISVESAEENFRVIKNQYDQSAATMTDLLNASVLLNEAKVAKSNAVYDVISSVYSLERLVEEELPIQ